MISSLSGTIRHKDMHSVVLDVSGVGYKIMVQDEVALEAIPSEPAFFWTHLAVRETALDLFGFPERDTLEIFELLITISGIGPKTAMGILNLASPATLREAVSTGETSYLTRVSGIGRKNAEKIVLELKDKIKNIDIDPARNTRSEGVALEALISLGYNERDSREALKKVPKDVHEVSERVKFALKNLAQNA